MALDLSSMSRKELLQLKDDLGAALKAAEIRERSEALKAAEKAAAEFGFSLSELSSDAKSRAAGKTTKALPKYFNPANPEQTWSGRGRKPQWVHDALNRGVDITEMEL
ncbi:H-NS family nucleoid-associated regulatory protein [Antarcticimicrobium sediminis]|uniref:H-NS histone family protein n=1 Tax=Antarcticimicrobium sediminis TaxID=2546227 RepID=A0A4R5EX62_9RHOB|nr:H-NS histone family protein [Antarcticimicrobium sediminis]TDE39618.1 H-NS histone family protein [Antarcticimicrobium sediminis]